MTLRLAYLSVLVKMSVAKSAWKFRQWILRRRYGSAELTALSKTFYDSGGTGTDGLAEFGDHREFACRHALRHSRGISSILDVGCGDGRLLARFHTQNRIGVDFCRLNLRWAKKRDSGIQVVLADVEHLPFVRGVFDMVTCFDVLEHVLNPDRVYREAEQVAKTYVYFTTDYDGVFCPRSRSQLVDNPPPLRLMQDWKCQLTFFRMGKPTSLWKGLLFGSGVMGCKQLKRA